MSMTQVYMSLQKAHMFATDTSPETRIPIPTKEDVTLGATSTQRFTFSRETEHSNCDLKRDPDVLQKCYFYITFLLCRNVLA